MPCGLGVEVWEESGARAAAPSIYVPSRCLIRFALLLPSHYTGPRVQAASAPHGHVTSLVQCLKVTQPVSHVPLPSSRQPSPAFGLITEAGSPPLVSSTEVTEG